MTCLLGEASETYENENWFALISKVNLGFLAY